MHAERRRSRRKPFANGHLPPAARVRPGLTVVIVNLSGVGALFESSFRFRPGHQCELQIGPSPADEGVVVGCRVHRCFVARVEPSAIRYRTAVEFDRRIRPPDAGDLLAEYQVPDAARPAARGGVDGSHASRGERAR